MSALILAAMLFAQPAQAQLNLTLPEGCLAPDTIVALGPIPSTNHDTRTHQLVRVALIVIGAGLDIHSTNQAMHVPGLREGNSWLYGRRPSLMRLVVTKAIVNAPLLWASHLAAKKEPIEGVIPVALSATTQGFAGIQNYRLIAKQRKLNSGGAL